jgi:hypothetical protein
MTKDQQQRYNKWINELTNLYLNDPMVAEPFVKSCIEEHDRIQRSKLNFTQDQIDANWNRYLAGRTGPVRDQMIVKMYFSLYGYDWVKELYQRNLKDIKRLKEPA